MALSMQVVYQIKINLQVVYQIKIQKRLPSLGFSWINLLRAELQQFEFVIRREMLKLENTALQAMITVNNKVDHWAETPKNAFLPLLSCL